MFLVIEKTKNQRITKYLFKVIDDIFGTFIIYILIVQHTFK